MPPTPNDTLFMARALEIARQGEGSVEPNPQVGCVLVRHGRVIAEGYHQRYGGPHAEVIAIRNAREPTCGATAYVTLEPCCHQGQTGPCTRALIQAEIAEVVIGCADPNPLVAGRAIRALRDANLIVRTGVMADDARELIAPFTKWICKQRPWVLAKWAMTIDGKIATSTGSSQWITSEASRARVHHLRGRVDAIAVGIQTALHDDPLLTARPPGPRQALRIVLDSQGRLPLHSKLLQSAHDHPLLVATAAGIPSLTKEEITSRGAEVVELNGADHSQRLGELLDLLGKRQITNLLVEGGGRLLGSLWDLDEIDEIHAFIGPMIVGGTRAIGPIGGEGILEMPAAKRLGWMEVETIDRDIYLRGRVLREDSTATTSTPANSPG
jgi:diaminohydroxyphosphoribosylaminopyrimidine deaminase/5-amino-6-(5-phosphoribosylamino)uracil reductase